MQDFPIQSEIHYPIQESCLSQELSPTVAQIMQLDPHLLLGDSKLFTYDTTNRIITLSPSFKQLLKLLVDLDELDSSALTAHSLYELNAILQQPQSFRGGLLRKAGTKGWELKDNFPKQKYRQTFDLLLQELGFILPKSIEHPMIVDHCLIFGARSERMEKRILMTLDYLKNNLKVTQHIFLLGSDRKLLPEEMEHLTNKLEKLRPAEKSYWESIFNDPEQSTEANAFIFLWKYLAPSGMAATSIKSPQNANTAITIEDWLPFYTITKPQALFAIAEKPYIRLTDQLRFSVLSEAKKANLQQLRHRIQNTTFYFASPNLASPPSLSIILDEVARNVYRVIDTLNYLEGLSWP